MRKISQDRLDASGSFKIDFLVRGKHSTILHLPTEYHAPIGLIVAYWGYFEVVFDGCLSGLIQSEADDGDVREVRGWETKKFSSRKKLFKEVCAQHLAKYHPETAKKLSILIDRAGDYHWQRNLIAHGIYSYTVLPHSSVATDFKAKSLRNNRELSFNLESLTRLYHDISHLIADLILTIKLCCHVEGQFFLLPDTELLRVYEETIHPWNPNPDKRPSPPESSRG